MILLPSRGRPAKLARFFEAYFATQTKEPGIVMLEHRDEEAYARVALPSNWRRVIVPESLVSQKFNDGAMLYAPGEKLYFLMADDCVPETPHWDEMLADVVGTGIAWGDDCITPAPPCGHPCISGELVRALGWIANPAFGHFYWDNALRDIADALGPDFVHYRPDVITRHLHFTVTGDRDIFERGSSGNDQVMYERWKQFWMQDDIERVRKAYGCDFRI